jgi:hypothetical protein
LGSWAGSYRKAGAVHISRTERCIKRLVFAGTAGVLHGPIEKACRETDEIHLFSKKKCRKEMERPSAAEGLHISKRKRCIREDFECRDMDELCSARPGWRFGQAGRCRMVEERCIQGNGRQSPGEIRCREAVDFSTASPRD